MQSDRNDPCPCGSNKKFKKCCYKVEPNSSETGTDVVNNMDPEVRAACLKVLEMLDFGDFINARNAITLLKTGHPDNPYPHFLDGICYSKAQDFASSICCYEKAIAACSTFPEAYFNLGFLYEGYGFIGKAINCFKKTVQIESIESELGAQAGQELRLIEKVIKTKTGLTLNEYITKNGLEFQDPAFLETKSKSGSCSCC